MLATDLKWASKSGSGCRWDDDFTFKFGNARLEIEDIEKYCKGHGTLVGCQTINRQSLKENGFTDEKIEDLIYKEHIYISKSELREIVYATLQAFNFKPKGIGLELGAGCAAISVELARDIREIEKIFAVEIVPEIVEMAQTSLIRIAGVQNRVIPVLGDFDNLKVEDESIDWIIEFDCRCLRYCKHHVCDSQGKNANYWTKKSYWR